MFLCLQVGSSDMKLMAISQTWYCPCLLREMGIYRLSLLPNKFFDACTSATHILAPERLKVVRTRILISSKFNIFWSRFVCVFWDMKNAKTFTCHFVNPTTLYKIETPIFSIPEYRGLGARNYPIHLRFCQISTLGVGKRRHIPLDGGWDTMEQHILDTNAGKQLS